MELELGATVGTQLGDINGVHVRCLSSWDWLDWSCRAEREDTGAGAVAVSLLFWSAVALRRARLGRYPCVRFSAETVPSGRSPSALFGPRRITVFTALPAPPADSRTRMRRSTTASSTAGASSCGVPGDGIRFSSDLSCSGSPSTTTTCGQSVDLRGRR